jgi:hypothetical protein
MRIDSYKDFNGKKTIDALGYGNERLKWRKSYTEGQPMIIKAVTETNLLNQLMNTPPPQNSSRVAMNELNEMLDLQSDLTKSDMKLIEKAEDDLVGLIVDHLKDLGVTDLEGAERTMNAIADFTDPLLYKLKNHYNRLRPHQLARVLNVEMYPIIGTTASSASYPSGHALDAFNFGKILAEKYPDHKAEIIAFCDKAAETRVVAGVHYRSDHSFSKEISKLLFDNNVLNLDMFN